MLSKRILPNEDIQEVRALYKEAFPEGEQIPYERLLQLIGEMNLDVSAYYENGSSASDFVGFTIVYPGKKYNWFWYFAVRPELRGKGYGQQILSQLIEKYKDGTNILDMESPEQVCENSEQRKRRHAFYLRNGFRDTGVGKSFKGIDYTIMMNGEGTFTQRDYDLIIDELRSYWDAMPKEG